MANSSICAEINGENIDLSCSKGLVKKYFQEIVVINFNDIDRVASTLNNTDQTCDYSVSMVLKDGKKGMAIKLPENGGTIKGFWDKGVSDLGFTQYLHKVQFLLAGISSEIKCLIDKLNRGRFVVVAQLADGTVEIYGWENGLTTEDFTWDIVEGGGGSIITMSSKENEEETMLPLLYKSAVVGGEDADFNDQFSQVAPTPLA